ncbi:MAG: NAD-dependent epimerase/dehydratase family protein [Tractidigestivibacter sp.]|jgi:dihydroflavonol-4-reductase|uniref:NAD-dependent epimerase/dehydratase family protein n=1 Tax=Tractidigestivibacter sp. TaxID=2847320 RepID=UPI003D8C2AAC
MGKGDGIYLVTGGTGFLAGWIIKKLLERGCAVRTTVRSKAKTEVVRSMLASEGVGASGLEFAVADLGSPDGWDAAMDGVRAVIHTASPLGGEDHEDPSLIPVAKSGVQHVLGAAIRQGVPRFVMTSSTAANYPDKSCTDPAVNEEFWTDPENRWITNYMRSKLFAERLAWQMAAESDIELVTILPGAILGPSLGGRRSSTDQICEMLLKGMPIPRAVYPVVDVRDLAELHILAADKPEAAGQRFIAQSEEMTMPEMADVLRKRYPKRKVSRLVIPDAIVGFAARFSTPMKVLNTMVDLSYHRDGSKARRVLGWEPRPAAETVVDTAECLISMGIA